MEFLNKDEHDCWACIHCQNIDGECDTYCDHGESFVQRKDVRDANSYEFQTKAHWYYNKNANDWGIGGWCCSNCNYKNDALGISEKLEFPINFYAGTNYCANCGCRMGEK